ncbi:hypothetical protein I3843_06G088900 [Carya illinoinensis]|uniref:Uncharacterized protein n=1 Tax=Carya illinoinensis TaxID=32201 RepID=A0A922JI88_CARIL|nr:hypothetical protein I3842_06G095300 [Carya illinoinensis]KAG7975247.1 hypothetical protein I3843_06G088900 [Carya illinoinensis]
MKLDSEPVLSQSTLGHKTDSKPFEYNNNVLASAMKSQNLIITENQERLSKGTERDAVQLPYAINGRDGWTAIKFDCSMSMDDLKNESEDEVRDFVASHTHSSRKTGFFDKDSDIVMDKGVMECELPELTVCYKENGYHVVKDICIDEGVPSQEKILFGSGRDTKTVLIVHPPEKDQSKGLLKEKQGTEIYSPDELMFSSENDSKKNSANQFDSKDLIQTEEDATESVLIDATEERLLPGNKLPMLERDKCASHLNCLNIDSKDVEQHPFQVSGENVILASPALVSGVEESNNSGRISKLASSTSVYGAKESNNSAVDSMLAGPALVSSAEETNHSTGAQILATPNLVSAAEESNNSSPVNEFFYNSKQERGSITFDLDSLAPAASARQEEGPETQNTSKFENFISDAHTDSRQLHHFQGETSFSAAGQGEENFPVVGTLSSLINYSGPTAYSGSVSLRSDSSATSTRSFAFPVLQSEWNSSPVRMAKADRRHLVKHKCWRKGFLCCRF